MLLLDKNIANLKERSSEDLMELYANGSYEAFEFLFQRYSKRTYGYFIGKIKNSPDADELQQLLFLKMHSSKHLFQKKYKFEQWLFVIARTVLIDFLRKNKKIYLTESIDEKEYILFQGTNAEEINDIETHLENLSLKEQEILKLRYVDELTFKEIAERLSQSEVSLRKFISRAIKKLKNQHGEKP